MFEDAASRLAQLVLSGSDIEVSELLDAVLLASVRSHSGAVDSSDGSIAVPEGPNEQPTQEHLADAEPARNAVAESEATGSPDGLIAPVWLEVPSSAHSVTGKRAAVGHAEPLPNALEIGRALRPFRRPWLTGVRQHLDIDATVEYFTRTGVLVPRLTPAPEPWLEVVVVLDNGTAMAIWDDTVRALTKTLRALAAFRDVRVWNLDHRSGEAPVIRDHQGDEVVMDPDVAHHDQPARRLLLVVTDCAAKAWRHDAVWRTLHVWGQTAPVALINPLPQRLWQHSGLDLPRTTASARIPASSGQLLSYQAPRLLRMSPETMPWQALPVLPFDPAQILAWARTLMRTDPIGCPAVLVPATGRPPRRHRIGSPSGCEDTAITAEQVEARTVAFLDDRESCAVRLALATAPLDEFTLPILNVLRERLVPEATLADTAEFLTAGLLTTTRTAGGPSYRFHPAAAEYLMSVLTRDEIWDTHFAFSDHLEAHFQDPHGISVILESPDGEGLPAGLRPIAHAAAVTAGLLGVEATDTLPPEARHRLTVDTPTEPTLKSPGVNMATSLSTPNDTLSDPTAPDLPVRKGKQKVQILLVDDLDGGEADETVTFGLDGKAYEIDLTTANADKLRGLLEPYVMSARRVIDRTAAERDEPHASSGRREQDTAQIRAWAKENGWEVSDRGRIPVSIRQAYERANS